MRLDQVVKLVKTGEMFRRGCYPIHESKINEYNLFIDNRGMIHQVINGTAHPAMVTKEEILAKDWQVCRVTEGKFESVDSTPTSVEKTIINETPQTFS